MADAPMGSAARPPLECVFCGMPRWNDTTVEWVDDEPYCRADGCWQKARALQ